MQLRDATFAVSIFGLAVGCRAKNETPAPEPPVVKKPGAPPEDLTDAEKEAWRLKLEERERERANRPPPETKIKWPAALETDLVDFNGWWIRLKARVEFDPDNNDVTPEAKDVLDDLVFILRDTPRIQKVEIQCHRHSQVETYGVNITQARANAVKVYIVGQGIDAGRIEAKGYGDTMPIESNMSELGRRANERVEIIVRQIDEHVVNTDQ
jgi:outer membrane protein OmpA-like peptidoglycan-associated protein